MTKLPFHEWLIISLLVATLLMLTAVTLLWKKETVPVTSVTHEISNEYVQITITGAVQKPGSYEFKKGTLLKELLSFAMPTSEANLEGMRMNAKLRDGQIVKVPAQRWITIYLEGAVEQPGAFKVKHGAFLEDLTNQVTFTANADIAKLQKKRRLKDDEVIVVPIKKEKSNPGRKKRVSSRNVEGI